MRVRYAIFANQRVNLAQKRNVRQRRANILTHVSTCSYDEDNDAVLTEILVNATGIMRSRENKCTKGLEAAVA